MTKTPGVNTPFISLRNISKVFSNGTVALKDISLDIERGECLVIAGANGSGKTVLMHILAGLTQSSAGSLVINGKIQGKERRDPGQAGRGRTLMGLVFQNPDAQFLGETVIEDAAFGPRNLGLDDREAVLRAEGALKALGLEEKSGHSPSSLSGGEKRRLAVAGILAMNAEIVIFDEPFANLDFPGVRETLAIIKRLKEEKHTVIILTHELEKVLALAGRLVILCRGSLACEGRPEKVLDGLKDEWGVRDPRKNYASVEDCTWIEI